ncbi:UDP-2,4-diacetamido-2,4,6-trideoxy-beta-L-altropyranose hydrolase [Iocasia frigidifontis]|uniref:UDP-2,4-diacetamido-2,4, 6-trideoxy-beta-L-altropyranose hydrolase n=1 Tax=Iocasia fonsfrigidae TaxID=2682810 RepID=A0A8A7KI30_9FIRM|nr:glycosyltransferase [Iocasia fonsfrigidae]QTL99725.1 UDP-2,4-diacetamido-2,4,6-trideoxy-beta-L-altropyranose hydrolase [Iocasia fonsfrigidae]
MLDNKAVLAIIPARGGSKGIPRKNVRFLADKPLISYSIRNALASKYIDKVIVSTDDMEIGHIAEMFGANTLRRPDKLATDKVPLDPVINHAVNVLEKQSKINYDLVVTLQATCPLLSTKTIDNAIEKFLNNDIDTLLSVVDDRHLTWTKKGGKYIPNYEERKNRQYLSPNYRETGGIVITKRKFITNNSRFGKKIDLIEMLETEAIDIDTEMDWWIAEKLLKRKKIIIRVDGYKKIGLGHIYRTLLLANRLIDHEFLFVSKSEHNLGVNIIKAHNYPVLTFEKNVELKKIIEQYKPDIVINDILDTPEDYIKYLNKRDIFVVNFEDMGEGAKKANLVINALYTEKYPLNNHYWGKAYYCLREEFYLLNPKKVSEEVKEILLTFGGTDSNNYTGRIIKLINDLNLDGIKITIIVGLGYERMDSLKKKIDSFNIDVEIRQNVSDISRYMKKADIVITSAGRTVYEIASIGTPTIVLAQNNRELRHTFACADNGIINLGLGYEVSDREIKDTLLNLVKDYKLRKKCNYLMLKNDLKFGINNVLNLIFKEHEKWKG